MAYAARLSIEMAVDRLLRFSVTKNLISRTEGLTVRVIALHSFFKRIEFIHSIEIVDAATARRAKDAAQKLEDLIDSHLSDPLILLSDQSSSERNSDDDLLLSQLLQKFKQQLSPYLTETLFNITDNDQQLQQISRYSSSDYTSIGNQQQNLLVGLDDKVETLKRWLLDCDDTTFVTSVVGMTGIGKTTLVKQVYNDARVIDKFKTRLYLHIGPQYTQYEDIMQLVLNQLEVVIPSDVLLHENKDYVKEQLSEALSSQKYLIVLDDVWTDTFVWHELEHSGFPSNGCVIIVSHIQSQFTDNYSLRLPLLTDDESWKLLRQTALSTSEERCIRELEKIGKKIAKNCEGLPAAIIQVGEELRGKSFQEWETLSENEDPLVITREDNTPLSKALYFSYNMLSQNLKVFFLYMGVFPKHYVISRSKIIKLWVSEGFLDLYAKMIAAEEIVGEKEISIGIEEIAGRHLDVLICRSLVLREKETSAFTANTKSCRLHFTFRSLCVTEAKSEKFFHILKKFTDCTPEKIISQQRLCVHNNVVLAFNQVHEWMESVPDALSLLCYGPKQPYPIVLPLHFRFLKILDALAIRFYDFPNQVLALLHLRYLAITFDSDVPNSIYRLGNLEVFIICRHHNIKFSNNGPVYLPIEIWKLHKLKQLYCMGFDLPPPPNDSHLENLLTLSGVSVDSCTKEVLLRIPKLEKIVIQIETAHDSTETFRIFGHFASIYDNFESFKCVVVNPNLGFEVVPCVPIFPVNIMKICLSGCAFPWKNMGVIAALPNLRVLKLRWYAFCGRVWETSHGQFPSLVFLMLEDLDIENWKFDGKSFIRLIHVIFRHCYKLKNIPEQLNSVELVEVDDCNPSFVRKIRAWEPRYRPEVKISSSEY